VHSTASQRGEDLKAAAPRKHHVQNQEFEVLSLDQKEAFLPGGSHGDLIALTLQAFAESLGKRGVIFYYERGYNQRPQATSISV
jgi:hypothetical protein